MIKAKDLVSAGLSFQENSGETLSPSQVKRTGMAPPGLKSELISCMELLRYWDCILDSMRTQGVARRQGLVWSKQKIPSPGGASRQESSGEMSSPSQVNPIGITPAPTGVRELTLEPERLKNQLATTRQRSPEMERALHPRRSSGLRF